MNEVANTAGRVFETGKSVGVGFEEVNAGLIAITQTGVKTDTSMTLLVNLFQKLLKPTKELQAVYDEMGAGTGVNFIRMNGGLAGALDVLRFKKATGNTYCQPSKWFNEIRGFQAFQIITDNMKGFNQGLLEQEDALERARKAKEAYEATPGFKFQKEAQEFSNELTTGLKTELLEAVMKVTGAFGGLKNVMIERAQGHRSEVGRRASLGGRPALSRAPPTSRLPALMATLGPLPGASGRGHGTGVAIAGHLYPQVAGAAVRGGEPLPEPRRLPREAGPEERRG